MQKWRRSMTAPWSLNKLMIRFEHLDPLAAYSIANAGIKKDDE